jgi:hypothetical protein
MKSRLRNPILCHDCQLRGFVTCGMLFDQARTLLHIRTFGDSLTLFIWRVADSGPSVGSFGGN